MSIIELQAVKLHVSNANEHPWHCIHLFVKKRCWKVTHVLKNATKKKVLYSKFEVTELSIGYKQFSQDDSFAGVHCLTNLIYMKHGR